MVLYNIHKATYIYMLFHSLHSLHPLFFHDADAVPYIHQSGHRMIDISYKSVCHSLTDHTKFKTHNKMRLTAAGY